MSFKEKAVVSLLTAVFFILFYLAIRTTYDTLQLDSALLVEMVDTTFEYHVPQTRLAKSVLFAIENLLLTPPEQICQSSLAPESPEPLNVFKRHSYLVLYLMAPFRFLFTSKSIVFFANAIAFIGVLTVAYAALRYSGVPIIPSAAFVFLVSAHPAWSWSAFGQFYPDKYFPVLGLIYICLLHRRLRGGQGHSAALLVVAVLAASITERAALTTAFLTLAYVVICRGFSKWRREDFFPIGVAVFILAYALAYMAFFQKNSDYASFQGSMSSFLANILHNAHYRELLIKFSIINVLFFGIFGAFEWRLGLIAAAAMLPNVIGSIGGAEKVGWTTHYHSVYFPFLVAAALFGFGSLWNRFRNSRRRYAIVLIPIGLGLCLALLDPFTDRYFDFAPTNIRNYAILKALEFQTGTGAAGSVIVQSKLLREVADSIPADSDVTTTEALMPSLYGRRTIHFYPLGLNSADYAILPYTRDSFGNMRLYGAVSYRGPEATNALDGCLNKRIIAAGYTTLRQYPAGGAAQGIAVLKRDKAFTAAKD